MIAKFTNFILDNLIAEGKALPMIVVIEDGGIAAGVRRRQSQDGAANRGGDAGQRRRGRLNFDMPFVKAIINDVIPMVDSTYRTIADRDHRAMAGLPPAHKACGQQIATPVSPWRW